MTVANKLHFESEQFMSWHATASSSLEIRLLGSFLIRVDGQPVEDRQWSRRSAKLLVKLLALQPHHQLHREQIIELLWPNLELESGINELNKALHAARRALEPELRAASGSRFLLTQQQQLVLRAPDGLFVDAAAFTQKATDALRSVVAGDIEAALALYKGDLLVEDPYEDWAAAQRESLRAAHHELLSRLSSLYEAERAYEPSIECLKKLVADEPSNENTHRRLMRLYATTGNKFLARQQYEQCRKVLRDDLGADPDPETIELSKLILLNQFQLQAPESPTIDSNSPAQMSTWRSGSATVYVSFDSKESSFSSHEPANLSLPAALLSAGNHSHTITGVGDSETRPQNAAVLYIIRVE